MLLASSEQARAALLLELTAIVNRSFRGHLPELVVPWSVRALLTVLRKTVGGGRPLAVFETLKRLSSKLGVSIVKDRAAMYFDPQHDLTSRCSWGRGTR
jgi:hypothetical protein